MALNISCRMLLGWLGLAVLATAVAHTGDSLPVQPDYIGEIRRGPDGRLRAVPPDPASAAPRSAAPARATMIVGPGERIATLGEAARLARDGEVIEIRPGQYRGQTAVWTQNDLLIRGAGDRPVMLADGRSAEGKAIWVVRGGKVRIENIEFRGARVPSLNGAGIRFEKGSLQVRNCAFFDNEMGILTANQGDMSLEIIDSEFGEAPRHAGDLHHLLYVGAIDRFVLRGSRLSKGYLGHLVKSRARHSQILYNLLVDGPGGAASYELEFPNGGIATVIGNAIGQSPDTDNPVLVSYGAEGQRWPDNALFLAHNTLVNEHFAGSFLSVHSEKFPAGAEVWLINNLLVGNGTFPPPALGRFEGNQRVTRAGLLDYAGYPLRLANGSPLRGKVRPPGSARGTDLLPDAEFVPPVGTRPLFPASALAPGAFQ